ncbi:hypothetical protein KPH14_006883 [Odynerus spinipes]|uniref:Odorant receptor n=1 Tax=Odynerus spinipes TaxID=1348599 RepID=A0AAD9RRB9_9HYME|nr:hypothetical protein KPH14_006883 [Odynerus spinipes]
MRFLRYVGLWPYQSALTKFLRSFTMFLMAESILIPEAVAFIKIARIDMVNILECIPTMIIALACGIKLINMVYNNEKMKMLLAKVIADWSLMTVKREKKILRSYGERARQFTIGYAYWMFLTSIMFVSLPFLRILNQDPETADSSDYSIIPFEVDYFVDTNEYYYPILIHCYLCTAAHVFIIIAVDTMFITFVQHTCGMFTILSYRVEHMADFEGVDERSDCDSAKNKAHRRIADCIFRHKELLGFVDLIESTYSTYFFIQLGLNMIIMSITGVQTMMNANIPHEFMRHLSFTIGQLVHLFFECWQAQQIIDHSVLLSESIGKAEWYRTSIKSKKLIAIMMMKSLVACKLTAGKMIVLCFESFTMVVSKSVSYFTVLRTLQ